MILKYSNLKIKDEMKKKKIKLEFIDLKELQAFLGLLLISGALKKQGTNLKDLWTMNSLYSQKIYSIGLSRNRFVFILRYIRFDNIYTREKRKKKSKSAPIDELLKLFSIRFRKFYSPSDSLVIDEQMAGYRGRCPFKTYIKSKPEKYGIKIWCLCDSKTFYAYNFQMYTGKKEKREVGQGFLFF